MVQEIRWEQPWPLQHPEHRQAPIVPYSWHMTFGNRHSPRIACPPHCVSHPCAVSRKEHKTPHHPFLRRRSHNQPNMLNPYSLVILRAYISRTINGTHLHCQPRSVKNVETKHIPKTIRMHRSTIKGKRADKTIIHKTTCKSATLSRLLHKCSREGTNLHPKYCHNATRSRAATNNECSTARERESQSPI